MPICTGARLKIKRANEHIADVERRIIALPETYVATIEMNLDTGQEFIKHALPQIQTFKEDLALVIGDAIHNLRSALDFSWIGILGRLNIETNDFAKFPVFPNLMGLENALKCRKIDIVSPALYEWICTDIQPHKGGNDDIWAIHRLDILDKHKLLIPVLQVASFSDISVEDEQGHISNGGFTFLADDPGGGTFFIPVPLNHKVKNKGHVAATVAFDNGLPCEGMEIAPTLLRFAEVILEVVQVLESV